MGELKTAKQDDTDGAMHDTVEFRQGSYIACVGISFGKPNPEVKVKAGEAIPDGIVPATIQDLLSDGAIKEAQEAEKEAK